LERARRTAVRRCTGVVVDGLLDADGGVRGGSGPEEVGERQAREVIGDQVGMGSQAKAKSRSMIYRSAGPVPGQATTASRAVMAVVSSASPLAVDR
jgi:hypothetical protein